MRGRRCLACASGWRGVSFAVAAAVLLTAGPVPAQPANLIGIYATAEATQFWTNPPAAVPFDVYFVLTTPRTAGGEPVTACDGFEYRVTITGDAGTLFRLADAMPSGWVNALVATNPWDARYQVHSSTPAPVSGDVFVLQEWTMMALGVGRYLFYLSPLEGPTVPGMPAYTYPVADGSVAVGAVTPSGDVAQPVFAVNYWPDPVENLSYGAVKALYR